MTATEERDVVRRLAAELAEIGTRPEQRAKVKAWERLNGLRPERPMLWITEVPWGEFENKVAELRPVCEGSETRKVEQELRRKLFTAKRLPCDEVVEPVYWLPKAISGAGWDVPTKEQQIAQGDSYVRSHHYEPVIADFPDIEKIRMPSVRYEEEQTLAAKERLENLFGGVLEVRVFGPRRHWCNAWDQLVRFTGVTEALSDLVDRPDFIHAVMRRMTDSMMARMEQMEKLGLLEHPHPVPRVGSGGAGYVGELPQEDYDPAHVRTMDQWGGATAQIFGEVSPAMHAEFALKYENEVMARCGLNYYGCCEALHNKMDLMDQVPRLRKVSISAWCDVAKAAATARRKYVFSHKPSPAILAEDSFDAARAEQEIRRRIELSGDMPCEFIMKDISTVRGDVKRLVAWCEMAWRVVHGDGVVFSN